MKLVEKMAGWIYRFPKGSIWQTRYICFPGALILSTVLLSQSPLSMAGRFTWLILGMMTWTLLEYILHRWFLHYSASSELGKAALNRLHVFHHHDTKDQSLVCIPPVICAFFAIAIWGLLIFLGAGQNAAALYTSGIAFMMVVYDITHFSVHYMPATNRLLQALKKQHMLHHFSDHSKRFGVTSPLWDRVFRTF